MHPRLLDHVLDPSFTLSDGQDAPSTHQFVAIAAQLCREHIASNFLANIGAFEQQLKAPLSSVGLASDTDNAHWIGLKSHPQNLHAGHAVGKVRVTHWDAAGD